MIIPQLPDDATNLKAAQAYGKAGIYILPVERDTKNPGSRVGKEWQRDKSLRDPKDIAAWFAGTDDDIAIDCGRSGLVVVDVDHPELLPSWLAAALESSDAPYQSTRPDSDGRGHHVFAQPPGRHIGCSEGTLAGMGLNIRGCGGVIMVQPSSHIDGGRYLWERTGEIPVLPSFIAEQLSNVGDDSTSAATDAEVTAFLAEHTTAPYPWLIHLYKRMWVNKTANKGSAHNAVKDIAPCAAEEAEFTCAKTVHDTVMKWFIEAVTADRGEGKRIRSKAQARKEFNSLWAWGIGRALAKTDEQKAEIRERVAAKVAERTAGQQHSGGGEPRKPGEHTQTDSGNAAILVREYRDRIRYVDESGKWIAWNGAYWHPEYGSSAAEYAARVLADKIEVPSIPEPMSSLNPNGANEEQMRRAGIRYAEADAHKTRSLSRQGILGAVKVAESDPDFRISITALDTHAYQLNTPNGIVDLTTGQLHEHDRNALHTRVTGVDYDTEADCPRWKTFLKTTFQGEVDTMEFMQRLAGYACIGEVTYHILPFLYGEAGQNGKSVLLKVLQQCLGSYAVTLPVSALVTGRNSHTEDTADLPGARLAVCSEIGQDTRWDEEKLKMMTGGDKLTARANYGHKFEFVPSHTIMIAANNRPAVDVGGKSFFRRITLIPFEHSVPDDEVNVRLAHELIDDEGSAILAWMVRGAVDVIDSGLRPPSSVEVATAAYEQSEDEVGQWIEECCRKVSQEFGQPGAKLYASYKSWCKDNGNDKPKNGTAFGLALGKHGHPMRRTSDARVRLGLMLLTDSDADEQTRFWNERD